MTKQKQVGTQKTEGIIGQAAANLTKAVTAITEANNNLVELVTTSQELTLQIADKEAKISELSTKYAEELRAGKVKAEYDLKEHANQIVTKWLSDNGKVAILNKEHEDLKNQISKLSADNQQEINKAVGAAVSNCEAKHKAEITTINANHSVKEAQNSAEINSLKTQVSFLTKEVENWKGQLDEERKASIERAKASSVGSINVSTPGK